MSVDGDGNDAGKPDTTDPVPPAGAPSSRPSRRVRHRVPPTSSASVASLPEPFSPAKPTFSTTPHRRRRDGPTAIATATVPTDLSSPTPLAETTDVPSSTETDPDANSLDDSGRDQPDPASSDDGQEPDPATVGTLAGEVRANAAGTVKQADRKPADPEPAAASAEPTVGEYDAPMTDGLEFIVSLPGVTDAASESAVSSAPAPPSSAPAPASSSVPESSSVTASTSVPASPEDEAADVSRHEPSASAPADAPGEDGPDTANVEPAPTISATALMGDDSPTVADYVPPAIAIVTDDDPHDDGEDYRGSRRKVAGWRRYPLGALAVAALILIITGVVSLQLVRSDSPDEPSADRVPQKVPGVDALPGGPPAETSSAAPTTAAQVPTAAASPTPSRSRASAAPPPPRSASPSPSSSHSAAPPPPAPPTTGQVVGAGSQLCMKYSQRLHNRVVLDNCDNRSNQRWSIQPDGSVRADNGCLDVANAATGNNTAVQWYPCNGTPAQKWVVRGDNTWLNPNSNRCLDAYKDGKTPDTPLVIWDCSAAENQRWTVR